MQVDYRQIESLLQLVSEEGIDTLELDSRAFNIRIQRQKGSQNVALTDISESITDGDKVEKKTEGHQVCAPVDGVFYRSASEGGTPLCEPGQYVERGTSLGIIEVMKIMNPLTSDCEGHVAEVLAADGEMVSQGQPLFVISRG